MYKNTWHLYGSSSIGNSFFFLMSANLFPWLCYSITSQPITCALLIMSQQWMSFIKLATYVYWILTVALTFGSTLNCNSFSFVVKPEYKCDILFKKNIHQLSEPNDAEDSNYKISIYRYVHRFWTCALKHTYIHGLFPSRQNDIMMRAC